MRRTVACGAIAAILLIPAEALSASRTYEGTADADSATPITLRVKQEGAKRYLSLARAENLLIHCDGGATQARLTEAEITGRVKVKDGGAFTAKASNGLQTVAVAGKIVKRTIKGTFRYSGFTDVDGQTMGCDSGKVQYTAKR